jgi:hypothetical protein
MIVNDFDAVRVAFGPDKAKPVLVVDPDAVLPGAVACKGLQVISRQREIAQGPRLVDLVEFAAGGVPDRVQTPGRQFVIEERFGVAVPERADHP